MLETTRQKAEKWERENLARAHELNDQLDACKTLKEKRVLFATFNEEEKRGVMPEYMRRAENKRVPVGSLVKSSNRHGIST